MIILVVARCVRVSAAVYCRELTGNGGEFSVLKLSGAPLGASVTYRCQPIIANNPFFYE